MQVGRMDFAEVVVCDFEYLAAPGERPRPVCLVAQELVSGRVHRLWQDELLGRRAPPYPVGPGAVFVSYYAPAELGCHLALGWPLPDCIVDLFAEFRAATNGLQLPAGRGLIGALVAHGLDSMAGSQKDAMRQLILAGGPWSGDERQAILDYCGEDVAALVRLLAAMGPGMDTPRALLRGAYTRAVAHMEHLGVPVDLDTLGALRERWPSIKSELIARVDSGYGVFEDGHFRAHRWAEWLAREGIPWPRLESGGLALDEDTFKDAARAHPKVRPMRELRHALGQLRLSDLAVGADGRNRVMLSPFGARTGRNTPSNSKFIFGPSTWLRSLIRPSPGWALAYVDWARCEVGIAAALSGDEAMATAYRSPDTYLHFAVQAGAAPQGATKESHGAVRELFKVTTLATQYGMGEDGLAARLGVSPARARELLAAHRRVYSRFWKWSDAVVDYAALHQELRTVFGWPVHVVPGPDGKVNTRSVRNYLVQGNGAELLRLAACLAVERGVRVVAPVHDALLVEAPLDELDQAVAAAQRAMADASRTVLSGFELKSDAKLVRYPERYQDERGEAMWATVMQLIAEKQGTHAPIAPLSPLLTSP